MAEEKGSCGNCQHLYDEHPKTTEGFVAMNGLSVDGVWWPCTHSEGGVDCTCIDYAVPGSILTIHPN